MAVLLVLVLIGIVVGGLIAGLGGGGAVLAVPALVLILGFDPTSAGTLSLLIVAAASVTALATHLGRGTVNWRVGAVFGAVGSVMAAVGSIAARDLDDGWLLIAFGVLVLAVAWRAAMRLQRPMGPAATSGRSKLSASLPSALGVGAVTGVFGAGGGFLVVPVLNGAHRMAMVSAVATSSMILLINCSFAVLSRMALGLQLEASDALPCVIGALGGAIFGRRLLSTLPERRLQQAMVALLVVVALTVLGRGTVEVAAGAA